MKLLENARRFANKAHKGQTYGEEFPYQVHLQAVESVLLRFDITGELLRAVAWLHDTLEDTTTTYEDLVTFFGKEIADTVADLTEPKGGNRAWRHEQTYPRIARNEKAIIVKLADRIANVEAGGNKTGMYRKEHASFKRHLIGYSENPIVKAMWEHLDSILILVDSDT